MLVLLNVSNIFYFYLTILPYDSGSQSNDLTIIYIL